MGLLIRILAAIGLAVLAYLLNRYAIGVGDKVAASLSVVVGIVCGYCGPQP